MLKLKDNNTEQKVFIKRKADPYRETESPYEFRPITMRIKKDSMEEFNNEMKELVEVAKKMETVNSLDRSIIESYIKLVISSSIFSFLENEIGEQINKTLYQIMKV